MFFMVHRQFWQLVIVTEIDLFFVAGKRTDGAGGIMAGVLSVE